MQCMFVMPGVCACVFAMCVSMCLCYAMCVNVYLLCSVCASIFQVHVIGCMFVMQCVYGFAIPSQLHVCFFHVGTFVFEILSVCVCVYLPCSVCFCICHAA